MRPRLLYLAPLPLLFTAFRAGALGMGLRLAAFALLILAAWLTQEGLRAAAEYDARRAARRPAIPRKMFASVLTGLGIGLAAWAGAGGFAAALAYGLIGAALHGVSFGLDPLRDKGMDGIAGFQSERVARAVSKAEAHLKAMSEAIARAGDRELSARVARFEVTAREMFRTIEDDPRDLTAARKYLVVYLMGAKDATIKFADFYVRTHDQGARADYAALLDDLENNFSARTKVLLRNDRADMDLEMNVLRERLDREGVKIG